MISQVYMLFVLVFYLCFQEVIANKKNVSKTRRVCLCSHLSFFFAYY